MQIGRGAAGRAWWREGLTYAVVTAVGVSVDVALASALALALGWPLGAAATAGFVVGMGVNWVLHTRLTFRSTGQPLSAANGLMFAAINGVILVVRLAVVWLLSAALPTALTHPTAIFVAAAGVSFGVNYVLLRRFLFRPLAARAKV